jgi:hypothetical protein
MAKIDWKREFAERYAPVPHTAEDTAHLLSDPEVKAAYDALDSKYRKLRHFLMRAKRLA